MTAFWPLLVAGLALFVLGVTAQLVVRDVIRRIVALNVGSAGVMLVLLAIAGRGTESGLAPDPVPQALVLTGIVVMAAITGLGLALARRIESTSSEDEAGPGGVS